MQEEPFTVIWLASVEGRLTLWKARLPSREGLEIHFIPRMAYCQNELMSTLHTIISEALPNSFRLCSSAVSHKLEEEFLSLHDLFCFKSIQNVLSFPLMDLKHSSWTFCGKNNDLKRWQSSSSKFIGLTVFLLVFNFNKTVHDDLFFFSFVFCDLQG